MSAGTEGASAHGAPCVSPLRSPPNMTNKARHTQDSTRYGLNWGCFKDHMYAPKWTYIVALLDRSRFHMLMVVSKHSATEKFRQQVVVSRPQKLPLDLRPGIGPHGCILCSSQQRAISHPLRSRPQRTTQTRSTLTGTSPPPSVSISRVTSAAKR